MTFDIRPPICFSQIKSPGQHLLDEMTACLISIHKKSVEELSDVEKLALCMSAGIALEIAEGKDNSCVLTTREDVGIVKIDGRFQIYVKKN